MLTVKAGEIWLDDPEDPQWGAEVFTQGVSLEGKDVVVLLGHGLGYRVMRLKDLGVSRIFVYEPDYELTVWVREQLPHVLDGVTVVHNFEALRDLFFSIQEGRSYQTTLLSYAGYRSAYPNAYERVTEVIHAGRAITGTWLRTLRERIPPIVEECLTNLGLTRGAVAAPTLGRALEGGTAFIVSAGPSLDRNIHLLRQAAEHGVIITNNTALPALRAHGIPVDLLVVIDSQSKASPEPGAYANVRALALNIGADPALHALPLPRAVFLPAQIIGDLGQKIVPLELSYGGSVATACVAVAETFGASNLVLIGQDCAYTGGRYYASGLGRDDYRVEALKDRVHIQWPERVRLQRLAHIGTPLPEFISRIDVREWSGEGTIWTTPDLEIFRQWFVTQALEVKGPRRWNATEGGAYIDGWESIPLADLLQQLPSHRVDLAATLTAAPPIDTQALLKARHQAGAHLRKGLHACRIVLDPNAGASARTRAQADLREAARALGAWEVHARGALFNIKGASTAEPDPHAILQAMMQSGERLLPLLTAPQ